MSKSLKFLIIAILIFGTSILIYFTFESNNKVKREEEAKNAIVLEEERKLKEAEEEAARIEKEKMAPINAKYDEAEKAFLGKDFKNAIKLSDEIIAEDPSYYKAINLKGISMVKQGNYLEGMPIIESSLQIKPDYPFGIFSKALAYDEFGHYEEALEYYLKHLEIESDYAPSNYGVAVIYAKRNDVEKSILYLNKAIEKDPSIKNIAKNSVDFNKIKDDPAFKNIVD